MYTNKDVVVHTYYIRSRRSRQKATGRLGCRAAGRSGVPTDRERAQRRHSSQI
jgi:hypothetical protein